MKSFLKVAKLLVMGRYIYYILLVFLHDRLLLL